MKLACQVPKEWGRMGIHLYAGAEKASGKMWRSSEKPCHFREDMRPQHKLFPPEVLASWFKDPEFSKEWEAFFHSLKQKSTRKCHCKALPASPRENQVSMALHTCKVETTRRLTAFLSAEEEILEVTLSTFFPEKASAIIAWFAFGGTGTQFCKDKGFPSRRWLFKNKTNTIQSKLMP
jgi:hypothetical protein